MCCFQLMVLIFKHLTGKEHSIFEELITLHIPSRGKGVEELSHKPYDLCFIFATSLVIFTGWRL